MPFSVSVETTVLFTRTFLRPGNEIVGLSRPNSFSIGKLEFVWFDLVNPTNLTLQLRSNSARYRTGNKNYLFKGILFRCLR